MQLQTTYLEIPTEEQREFARKAVNSTAESVKRDVNHLIEWFEKQPHLPNYNDEDTLAFALLHCKNSLEKTKHSFEKFFNFKASFPEMFMDRNPFEKCFEDVKNLAMYVPMRKFTPDGNRIMMLYLSNDLKTKTDIPPANNFIKMSQMGIELLTKVDCYNTTILVHDLENFSYSFLTAISSHIQKFVVLNQSILPIRFKKIYCFNTGLAGEIVLNIVKSFLKKKVAERIEILKNPEDLCEVLPKEMVPREYGGDNLPLEQLKDLWFEEIKNNYDFLKSNEKFVSDLSKLPKDSATTELSGVAGSFRQISVD